MQSSLCCAACATPLRPDAAGHGHYRMKNASVGAVAACSRPCGAIGLMLAAIGAPPTKRTADDAEMTDNEPKAGRGEPVVMSAQRQADRRRVERWLYVLRAEMEPMYAYPSGLRSTERLKATVLLIGDDIQITNAEAVELLRPLDERLQTMLAAIDNPAMPDYDIDAIGDVARNIVRRITRRQQMEALAPAVRPESYLGWVPRDVQNMVAAFAAPSVMPYSLVEIPRLQHTVFLKQYMCTFQQDAETWRAYRYTGTNTSSITRYENWVTETSRAGNRAWYFEPDNAAVGDIIRIEIFVDQLHWRFTQRGESQLKSFDIDGFPICADISRNILWIFSNAEKQIVKIHIHADGITQTPIVSEAVSQMIENRAADIGDLSWTGTAIKDGFYMQRRASPMITVCNVEADDIRAVSMPYELAEAKFDYGSDGMFYAFAFVDKLPTIARYASVPTIVRFAHFNRSGREWTEGARNTIRIDGSRVIMIAEPTGNPIARVCIVDTKLL